MSHPPAAAPVRLGWIGLGRMGLPMAGKLLDAGHRLVVFARSAPGREALAARGAVVAPDVAGCAAGADVVFASLTNDDALRQVALGPAGVLAHARPGAVFVDTTTVSAEVSAEVAAEARRRGLAYLRAPISGNAAQAVRGEVTVLVSGPAEAWARVQPLCAAFSRDQVYLGEGEQARVMKLVVNALVYDFAQALAEALTLGRAAGIDWALMLDTVARSTIASPWLKVKAGLLARRDFTATMTPDLVLKDMDLMLDLARRHGVAMPLTAGTRQAMQALVGEGMGAEDYLAVVKLAERQAGLPGEP